MLDAERHECIHHAWHQRVVGYPPIFVQVKGKTWSNYRSTFSHTHSHTHIFPINVQTYLRTHYFSDTEVELVPTCLQLCLLVAYLKVKEMYWMQDQGLQCLWVSNRQVEAHVTDQFVSWQMWVERRCFPPAAN